MLNENVPQAYLQKVRQQYNKDLYEGNLTINLQFKFAVCLIRSKYAAHTRKGISLIENLQLRQLEPHCDYIYYLAFGYARLKRYEIALRYLDVLRRYEPNEFLVISLEEQIKKKMRKETLITWAVTGGVAMVLIGLIGLGKWTSRI